MLIDYDKLDNASKMALVLSGLSFPMHIAMKNLKQYGKYKAGVELDLTDYAIADEKTLASIKEKTEYKMKALNILERLGYPLDCLGTHLYLELIDEAREFLDKIELPNDLEKCKSFLAGLREPLSEIYKYIAREYLEIGIKPFHEYIEDALTRIDEEKVDKDLYLDLFGENPELTDYGTFAFQIAAYVNGLYSMKNVEDKPMTLKLVKEQE